MKDDPVLLMLDFEQAVIDLAPDICLPAAKRAQSVLTFFRSNGWPVIHVFVGFVAGFKDLLSTAPLFAPYREQDALVVGTADTEPVDFLAPTPDELVVRKRSVSPFIGTPLAAFLSRLGPREVVLCGISTNVVVESTAREGADRGWNIVVLRDCCTSAKVPPAHQRSIEGDIPLFARVTDSATYMGEATGAENDLATERVS